MIRELNAMECRSKMVVICWLAASLLHAPFPVVDADTTTGHPDCCFVPADFSLSDIDFVLLGCDLPEDSDDGPIDNQPERGSGPFAASHVAFRAADCSGGTMLSGPCRACTLQCTLPHYGLARHCPSKLSARRGAAFSQSLKTDVSRSAILQC